MIVTVKIQKASFPLASLNWYTTCVSPSPNSAPGWALLRQGDGARVVDGGGLGPRNADDGGGDGGGDGDVRWAAADDWSGGVDYSDCGGRRRIF